MWSFWFDGRLQSVKFPAVTSRIGELCGEVALNCQFFSSAEVGVNCDVEAAVFDMLRDF